jgi:hypothetical protein
MPRGLRLLVAWAAATGALSGLSACSACPAEARALVEHPEFDSPAAAGASFFAALGCDDAAGEYRAFGAGLKRRYGATLDLWLLARADFREELGASLRFAHRLRPGREETREDGVLVWWEASGAERVGLLMQAQHFLELEIAGREVPVGIPLGKDPGEFLQLDGRTLRLLLEVEDAVFRGVDIASVTRVTLATEWKIADCREP